MSALSRREREVLQLLAAGESNKAIARDLGIVVATVERHVASIYRKVGARGRADAALAAVALGLVDRPRTLTAGIEPIAAGFPVSAAAGSPRCLDEL